MAESSEQIAAQAMAQANENEKSAPMEIDNKTAKDYYFDSYSHFGIHEEMLKDFVRTDTYRKSMVNNAHLFEGKTVLDVGCGTGILCMFAAQAGAAHVYGVDCADIVHSARDIVAENGFADRITILKGKIEEIQLPVEKVDIIISEWMGYCLLYESMVDSVLFARDKWLAPDGVLMPDKAHLYLCAIEDAQYRKEKLDFWDDVYGFKMSCIKKTALTEPLVDVVPANQIISNSVSVKEFDLYTIKVGDLDFTSDFELSFSQTQFCHAITAYFDVQFSKCHVQTGFTTAPFAEYTHWKQTVFYLDTPIRAAEKETIKGTFSVKKNPQNHRDLNIHMRTTTAYDLTQERRYLMR